MGSCGTANGKDCRDQRWFHETRRFCYLGRIDSENDALQGGTNGPPRPQSNLGMAEYETKSGWDRKWLGEERVEPMVKRQEWGFLHRKITGLKMHDVQMLMSGRSMRVNMLVRTGTRCRDAQPRPSRRFPIQPAPVRSKRMILYRDSMPTVSKRIRPECGQEKREVNSD